LLAAIAILLSLLLNPQIARGQDQANHSPTSKQIRSHLQEILHRPEFSPESTQPSQLAKALDRVRARVEEAWKRFTDWLQKLFRGREGSMGTAGTAIVYTLIAALVTLGVITLARIILEYNKNRGKTPVRATQATPQPVALEPAPVPSGEWIANAAKLAASRDFRGAFRAVFMAILMEMSHTGQLEYERSRTNGDYVLLLRSRNLRALYELITPLARDFDRLWYGNRPATETDYQRSLAAFHRLPRLKPDTETSDQARTEVGSAAPTEGGS
jgi:hypothetical protein